MAEHTFTSLEREGWSRNAADYDGIILDWTSQAYGPILETFEDLNGKRLLDVASGTGHLVRAAVERGAAAEGLDISAKMVALAGRSFPGLTFRVGSADALPYADGAFDAVTCCFGLLHLERPEAAVAEVYRVLRPGGRFSYTTWHGPTSGGILLGLMLKTFQRLANMDVGLPPAPPIFQFAEAETRDRVLGGVGFVAISPRDIDIRWRAARPEEIGRLLREGMVRMRLVFERQTASVQRDITEALIDEARAFVTTDGVEIPNAAHLATALKPSS